ncbi:MAG: galactokinase [Pseudomonadota bacterium]
MTIDLFFEEKYGAAPHVSVFVPGRVNLIGEHIDYNGGRVLPHALHRGVSLALSLREDQIIRVISDRFEGTSQSVIGDAPPHAWARYAVYSLQLAYDLGWITSGADLGVVSNLNDGAGLSSSAALCVAVLKSLRSVLDRSETDIEIAQLARRVENEYIGMPCGIMDQMAVSVAKPGEALFLDTAALDYEAITLPRNVAFVVLHSGVHRELADGRYKMRKEECDTAKRHFGTENLCQLPLNDVLGDKELPETIKHRVRHCILEHERTIAAAQLLRSGSITEFGLLMNESHLSMRDDFDISLPQIDDLVSTAQSAGALGARLTGGGFGGCIVAAVERPIQDRWVADVLTDHPHAFLVE